MARASRLLRARSMRSNRRGRSASWSASGSCRKYWPLLRSGTVKLLIDDPTTHAPDGYAVDFVRVLVNPHPYRYAVSITGSVVDADANKPIAGARVTAALTSAATDATGRCTLKGLPAGLVVASATAPGYDEAAIPVDVPSGQTGRADFRLHRHRERNGRTWRARSPRTARPPSTACTST